MSGLCTVPARLSHLGFVISLARPGTLRGGCTHTNGALPPSTAVCRARKRPPRGRERTPALPVHLLQVAETALQLRQPLLDNRNRNVMSSKAGNY